MQELLLRSVSLLVLMVLVGGCASDRYIANTTPYEYEQPDAFRSVRDNPPMQKRIVVDAYQEGWRSGVYRRDQAVIAKYRVPDYLNGDDRYTWRRAYEEGVMAGAAAADERDLWWLEHHLEVENPHDARAWRPE